MRQGQGHIHIFSIFKHHVGKIVGRDRLRGLDLQRLLVIILRLLLIPARFLQRSQDGIGAGVVGMTLRPLLPGADRIGRLSSLNLHLRVNRNRLAVAGIHIHGFLGRSGSLI